MNQALITATLRAIRATLAAAVLQIDALLSAAQTCTHPKKIDLSTLGHPRWECPDCGAKSE